jgi:hypothetical protein
MPPPDPLIVYSHGEMRNDPTHSVRTSHATFNQNLSSGLKYAPGGAQTQLSPYVFSSCTSYKKCTDSLNRRTRSITGTEPSSPWLLSVEALQYLQKSKGYFPIASLQWKPCKESSIPGAQISAVKISTLTHSADKVHITQKNYCSVKTDSSFASNALHETCLLEKQAYNSKQTNSVLWVRERTIPTERPPLVGEVRPKFLRIKDTTLSAWRIPTAVFSVL